MSDSLIDIDSTTVWDRYGALPAAWLHAKGGFVVLKSGGVRRIEDVVLGNPHPRLRFQSDDEWYSILAFSDGEMSVLQVSAAKLDQMESQRAQVLTERAAMEAQRVERERIKGVRKAYLDAVAMESPRDLCHRRSITQLVHFTQFVNLASILRHGIHPRSMQYKLRDKPAVNDEERVDGRPDASSFTISHPNEPVFEQFRMRQKSEDWVILLARPALLWEAPCELFYQNAARGSGNSPVKLKAPKRPSASELDRLFDEPLDGPTRRQMRHRDCDTTNPQAEVMIYGIIQMDSFIHVAVPDVALGDRAQELIDSSRVNLSVVRAPELFGWRECSKIFRQLRYPTLISEDEDRDFLRNLLGPPLQSG